MPPISPAQNADLVRRGLDILRNAENAVSGRDPNYLRDAQPEDIFEALPLAGARQGCRRYADKGGDYSSARAARMERACRPYLDSIDYGAPPTIEKPFTGGQCPVGYLARYETRNRVSTQFNCGEWSEWTEQTGLLPASVLPTGPIGGVSPVREFGSFPGNTNASISYQIQAANGTYFLNLGGTTGRLYFTTCGESWEYRNLRFEAVEPLDDECGIIPPIFTPPGQPVGGPGPRIEPFNPRPGINVDIGVEVNPDFTIDIDFGTGPITIDPFGDGDPGGGTGGPPPGDIGSPGGGGDTGLGGEDEGEAPPGSVLTGVRVQILEFPESRNKFTDTVFRGAYYAYLGVPGLLDHDPAGAMALADQFIFAEKDNLTAYRVSANTGYNLRVTPYYREVED